MFNKKPARKYKTRGWALVVGLRWVARIKSEFLFFLNNRNVTCLISILTKFCKNPALTTKDKQFFCLLSVSIKTYQIDSCNYREILGNLKIFLTSWLQNVTVSCNQNQ